MKNDQHFDESKFYYVDEPSQYLTSNDTGAKKHEKKASSIMISELIDNDSDSMEL